MGMDTMLAPDPLAPAADEVVDVSEHIEEASPLENATVGAGPDNAATLGATLDGAEQVAEALGSPMQVENGTGTATIPLDPTQSGGPYISMPAGTTISPETLEAVQEAIQNGDIENLAETLGTREMNVEGDLEISLDNDPNGPKLVVPGGAKDLDLEEEQDNDPDLDPDADTEHEPAPERTRQQPEPDLEVGVDKASTSRRSSSAFVAGLGLGFDTAMRGLDYLPIIGDAKNLWQNWSQMSTAEKGFSIFKIVATTALLATAVVTLGPGVAAIYGFSLSGDKQRKPDANGAKQLGEKLADKASNELLDGVTSAQGLVDRLNDPVAREKFLASIRSGLDNRSLQAGGPQMTAIAVAATQQELQRVLAERMDQLGATPDEAEAIRAAAKPLFEELGALAPRT